MAAYDEFFKQEQPAAVETPLGQEDRAVTQSPYSSFFEEETKRADMVLGASVRSAVNAKPDQVAKHISLAEKTGVPISVVERNPEFVEQQARAKELRDLARVNPILAEQLRNPEFTKIAHDDAETLGAVEGLLPRAKNIVLNVADALYSGAVHKTNAGLWGGLRAASEIMGKVLPLDSTSKWFAEQQKAQLKKAESLTGDAKRSSGFVERNVYEGIESLGANLTTLPLAIISGNPAMALAPMTAQAFGSEYGQARETGRGVGQSLTYAASQATIEYATEKLPMSKLIGDLKAGTPFWKTVTRQLATEIPGEQAATVLQDLNEWAVLHPDKPFSDYIAERPSAAAATAIQTIVNVGGQTTVAKGIQAAVEAVMPEMAKATEAERTAQLLQQLDQLAQASKLHERSPNTFGEFVQRAAQDGPLSDVYVSGQALQQALQGVPEAPQLPPEVQSQLAEATATGGDVRIPMGFYAAHVAATPLGQALLPDLKTEDGWSANEAQAFYQEQATRFQEEAQRVLAEQQGNEAAVAEAEAIKQHFTAQLTAANRFVPEVNEAYASLVRDFYVTTASRLGITPQQLMQRYPLRIAAESVAGDVALDQRRGPNPSSFVGVHYGNVGGLDALDAGKFGTGTRAEEAKRIPSDHPVLTKRVNFYRADGSQLPESENVVTAPHTYRAKLDNVYDFSTDPDNIIDAWRALKNSMEFKQSGMNPMTALEQMVAEAGYDGYFNPSNNSIAMVGRPAVPAEYLGTREQAAARVAQETVQAGPANLLQQGKKAVDEIAGLSKIEKSLTPTERAKLRTNTAKALLDQLEKLPSAEEMADVALAGVAKRGWYAGSAEALVNVFGPDAPRFAALLAALSPQTSVESNLYNTLQTWKNWVKAGRPTDRERIIDIMGESVQGGRGRASVLQAWINNAVRALTAEDPGKVVLSGPKVNSFMLNLVGVTNEVTNDAWMANYAAVDQTIFGGTINKAGTDPGKSPAYLAMSVRVREAAARLTKLTGDVWTPAEVQETVWSWAKATYEAASTGKSAVELLKSGAITDELINATPDFRTLFHNPTNQRILEEAGYGEQIRKLQTPNRGDARPGADEAGIEAKAAETARRSPSRHLLTAAGRLDALRAARLAKSAEGVEDTTDKDRSDLGDTVVNIGLATNDGQGITVEQAVAALKAKGVLVREQAVHQSNTEQTLVAKLDRPLTPEEANAVSAALRQDAIAQVTAWSGELYGPRADQWRPFSPAYFLTLTGKRANNVLYQTDDPYAPGSRGQIAFDHIQSGATITLLKNADLSTFLHETGHLFLEITADIAQQPNAPAEIVDDMNRVLKWMGVASFADWVRMPFEAKRPYHEKFARGFEAYLFEGKSPSIEMTSVFAKFRAWLINVYQSLTSLNVSLDDEVRGVFDRMLASQAQIDAHQAMKSLVPAFDNPAQAQATAEEWSRYQALGAQAREDAVRELERRSLADMKWVQGARGRYLKALQAEADDKRNEVRHEVTAEVEEMEIYKAIRFLTTGKLRKNDVPVKGVGLSLEGLKDLYGDGPDAAWRWLPQRGEGAMVSAEGLHPDRAAELLGFTSGDELVQTILRAEPMDSVIEGMTDQRMLERYGDLATPAGVEKAANEAVHTEARARFVATELQFLSRAAVVSQPTQRGGSVNVLAAAAKNFAEGLIARKRINQIRPAQYERAEARAAKAAAEASDPRQKLMEKRNQLINLHAARVARKVETEIERSVRYLKKVEDSEAIDPEYRDQIQQLLERFDLRAASGPEIERRKSLNDWVNEQREMGFEPQIDKAMLAEAQRQHYSTLSVEEFRGLVQAIKNIEHLGRLKNKLLTAKDEREFKAHVDEVSSSIRNNATGTVKERKSSDRGPLVALGSLFRRFTVDHRKFASLAREMDGMKDGGAVWEHLVRTMNEAGAREATLREQTTVKLAEIFKPILKGPKLGTKMFIPAVNRSFTREERLGIALNMGNAVNRERVMTGEGWTPTQLQAVIDTLSKEETDFVQAIWDYANSFKPMIAEKMKRVSGVEPEWVEAEPWVTRHGTYPGGYYPIKYDPLLNSRVAADAAADVEKQMLRGLYVNATTRRGHLEARAESTGRRLRYDLGVIMSHADQVIHDLSWHEWLIDANRLLRAKPIDAAIREHYGPEKLAAITESLRDIALGEIPAQKSWEQVLNHLRHGATIVGLGYNVVVSALQPFGLAQSMVRIGPAHVMRGIGKWIADPERSTAWIYSKSDMMRLRGKTLQREINEIRNQVANKSSAVQQSFFYLIQTMQKVADVPTWLGMYEKVMREPGRTEADAIALADQAVLDSQGGGQIKDLAGIQKGGAALKLWTNFYSYFNVTYNLAVERTKATKFTDPLSVGRLAVDYLLLFIVPSVLGTLMKEALKFGDDDDEEKIAKKIVSEQLSYLFGMMVGLREIGSAVSGFYGYTGPAGTRFFADAAKLAKQAGQGEVDEAALKAAANVGGAIFHLPTGQVVKSVDGLHALITDKTDNPGAILVGSEKN